RRHEGEAAFGILAKQAEIGRRVTEPEHPLPGRIGPARPDAAVDQLPRHDAEALRIEIAEIDDVDGHGHNLPHRVSLRRAENGIAAQALTLYFLRIMGLKALTTELSWPRK